MGAWDTTSFGNDTANDWAYGLLESNDFSLIEATLQKVLDFGDEYLEAPEAEEGIAASELSPGYLANQHPLMPTPRRLPSG